MKSAAKEAGWRERLKKQAESGLSVRAFCRREGLSEPSFYSWRRELDKRDRQRTSQADAAATRSAAGAAGLVAVDVVGVPGEATLEIAVAGGVVIRLREEASAETLTRVLAAACRQRAASAALENAIPSEVASC
jgi:transposase-like protein